MINKMILEINILDEKTKSESVDSIWHAYYLTNKQGKWKTLKKVRTEIERYLDGLNDRYEEVHPSNAKILAQQEQFRRDVTKEIQFYNNKHRGNIYVQWEDPKEMVIKIHYNDEKKLAK